MKPRKEVEEGLKILVETAKKNISNLKEIRVFGSYNNGNWNSERSDIDIYIEINDLSSSFISGEGNPNYERVPIIRKQITEALKGNFIEKRLSINILNEEDIRKLWDKEYVDGKGGFGKNVKQGRLLFPINN